MNRIHICSSINIIGIFDLYLWLGKLSFSVYSYVSVMRLNSGRPVAGPGGGGAIG